jgi:GT2 family glycosyltransferase
MQISVVIPTRNRPELLRRLLDALENQNLRANEIIVVESSDDLMKFDQNAEHILATTFVYTEIRSAAIQRNIGLDRVSENCDILFFLDDDVLPQPDYLEKLSLLLIERGAIGVSGLAINPKASQTREKPTGIYGLVQKLFMLDSKHDGKLLLSGVNIPVRVGSLQPQEVEWLIGCAAWSFPKVKNLRFESDFFGQSLAEDVIFSFSASKFGTLITDPSVILFHDESEIGRASNRDHWEMWMTNRWRLIQVQNKGRRAKLAFWWTSLGQLTIVILSILIKGDKGWGSVRGVFQGGLKIKRASK